jgi:hypothetical protein
MIHHSACLIWSTWLHCMLCAFRIWLPDIRVNSDRSWLLWGWEIFPETHKPFQSTCWHWSWLHHSQSYNRQECSYWVKLYIGQQRRSYWVVWSNQGWHLHQVCKRILLIHVNMISESSPMKGTIYYCLEDLLIYYWTTIWPFGQAALLMWAFLSWGLPS